MQMKTSAIAMKTTAIAILLALALVGCRQETPDTDAAQATAPEDVELAPGQPQALPVEPPADAVLPVTVAANAFPIGSVLSPEGAATTPKATYSVNDTLYASIPAGKFPSGATARIYWTYAKDGTSHKEEEKEVGSGPVNFQFSKADGLKAGEYNVEIDINDRPIGIVDVVVN